MRLPLLWSPCSKLWLKISTFSLWTQQPPLTLPHLLWEMKQGDRHDWTLFSSLSGKASQQACYWQRPPGEGVGQWNRKQGTILDHLTIISKCTPVAISTGPPWECSFCSQLCLRVILLRRNLVMQIALLTSSFTMGKEAGMVLEHAAVQQTRFPSYVLSRNNL